MKHTNPFTEQHTFASLILSNPHKKHLKRIVKGVQTIIEAYHRNDDWLEATRITNAARRAGFDTDVWNLEWAPWSVKEMR